MYKLWLAILLFASGALQAQDKYWIYFTDKGNDIALKNYVSPKTIAQRESADIQAAQFTDLPLNKAYLDSLSSLKISPLARSRWLNAVSARLTGQQAPVVRSLGFVKEVSPVNDDIAINALNLPADSIDFNLALMQINGWAVLNKNLTGKGVDIGIIDGGFYGANTDSALHPIFKENRYRGSIDLVNPDSEDIFNTADSESDWHGTMVWRYIGGKNGANQTGLAPNANYYIARTDHGRREFRGEEDNWIAAVEWMDSLGVRIINTSLGYSINFDDPDEDYKPEEMDGQTSAISRAAQIAVEDKGLLIIVSAGNDGEDPGWRVISTPADAEGVIAVGATNFRHMGKAPYSAIGPDFLPYLKPNVSCFSLFGTSFSAPVVTGLAAALMEYRPNLTNKEIGAILEKSAHLYPYGNNYVGYGVPDAARALELADNPDLKPAAKSVAKKKKFKIRTDAETAVVYHKKDERNVIEETLMESKTGKYVIEKPRDARRTTFTVPGETIEIIWK